MGAEQGQQAQQGECGVGAEQHQRRFSTLVCTRVSRYQQIKLVLFISFAYPSLSFVDASLVNHTAYSRQDEGVELTMID